MFGMARIVPARHSSLLQAFANIVSAIGGERI
jgi:hypothetical protein